MKLTSFSFIFLLLNRLGLAQYFFPSIFPFPHGPLAHFPHCEGFSFFLHSSQRELFPIVRVLPFSLDGDSQGRRRVDHLLPQPVAILTGRRGGRSISIPSSLARRRGVGFCPKVRSNPD